MLFRSTSKRELFLRAFDQYSERGFQGRIAVLEADRPAIERFRDLFASTIDDEIAQGRRGCLVVNTVAEFGERDPEIRARINADTRRHLSLLTACALAGQRDGTVDATHRASDIAEFAHSTVAGLRLMSRRGSELTAMRAVADLTVDAIAAR